MRICMIPNAPAEIEELSSLVLFEHEQFCAAVHEHIHCTHLESESIDRNRWSEFESLVGIELELIGTGLVLISPIMALEGHMDR